MSKPLTITLADGNVCELSAFYCEAASPHDPTNHLADKENKGSLVRQDDAPSAQDTTPDAFGGLRVYSDDGHAVRCARCGAALRKRPVMDDDPRRIR